MRHSTLLLLSLCLAAPAWAGPGGPHGDDRRGRHGDDHGARFGEHRAERLAEILGLSAEQRAAADKLHTDHRAAARAKFDELRALRDELRGQLEAANPDPAAVGSRTLRIHALREEMRAERERLAAEFEKLLDEKQAIAWKALEQAREGRGPRRGFGPGPGFGRHHGPHGGLPPESELD